MFLLLCFFGACQSLEKATTFSKADSTAVLQAIFDFSNADFDTVAAISKRQSNDRIFIYLNKVIVNQYDLKIQKQTHLLHAN